MRRLAGLLILSLAIQAGAQSAPAWITKPQFDQYPESRFIVAVGSATISGDENDAQHAAERRAISSITQQIEARVSSSSTRSTRETLTDGQSSSLNIATADSVAVTSDQVVSGARIIDHYVDRRTKISYAAAVLDRRIAGDVIAGQMETLRPRLAIAERGSLVEAPRNGADALFSAVDAWLALYDQYTIAARRLSVIDPNRAAAMERQAPTNADAAARRLVQTLRLDVVPDSNDRLLRVRLTAELNAGERTAFAATRVSFDALDADVVLGRVTPTDSLGYATAIVERMGNAGRAHEVRARFDPVQHLPTRTVADWSAFMQQKAASVVMQVGATRQPGRVRIALTGSSQLKTTLDAQLGPALQKVGVELSDDKTKSATVQIAVNATALGQSDLGSGSAVEARVTLVDAAGKSLGTQTLSRKGFGPTAEAAQTRATNAVAGAVAEYIASLLGGR